jgi:AbrB family looped-hinge helix DNA binding protein
MVKINGKMTFMNATVEIDKAGRIVVPKKMRDSLHLRPGERLSVVCNVDSITIARERKPRGLYEKGGWLVYDGGGPTVTTGEVNRWIDADREERIKHILGPGFDL